jgi:hypothetical protein
MVETTLEAVMGPRDHMAVRRQRDELIARMPEAVPEALTWGSLALSLAMIAVGLLGFWVRAQL